MDLDELKGNWEAMSHRVEQLEIINEHNIMEMTKQRYKSKFNHLQKFETMGSVICFLAAGYILFNFAKLDTPFYIICGSIISLFMVALPILTLSNINRMKTVALDASSYKNTVSNFEKAKRTMLKTQQLSIPVGGIVFFMSMPLFNKLFGNGEFMDRVDTTLILLIIPVFILLMLFSFWGYKKYKQVANSAEHILKELDE